MRDREITDALAEVFAGCALAVFGVMVLLGVAAAWAYHLSGQP